MNNQAQFLALNEQIKKCVVCASIENKGRAVPFEGDLDSPVLFVGRNPGREEYRLGRPFVGPGGKCLDRFIEAAGLTRQLVVIANMVCCFTEDDRPPSQGEIDCCVTKVKELIGLQKPRIVVALGKQCLQALALTNDSPAVTHGKIYDALFKTSTGLVESKVFASWHPGSAVRNQETMRAFMADALKLKTWLMESSHVC